MEAKSTQKKAAMTMDQAVKEFNDWLDWKKVAPSVRESSREDIDKIVEAMTLGHLVIENDQKIRMKLRWPLEMEGGDITELTVKPRLTDKELRPYLRNVKHTDIDGRVLGYKAALTNELKVHIENLDSVDNGLLNSIVVFFMG